MSANHTAGVSALAIEQVLRQRLNPVGLEVIDESHLHAGHVGKAFPGPHPLGAVRRSDPDCPTSACV